MPETMQLSVLMPAYNEADRLRDNLSETLRTLECAAPGAGVSPFEVILVDDGSADGTAAIAGEVARQDPRLTVVSYQPNAGKGAALRRGFECSRGHLIAFLDADLDLHPRLLFDLYEVMCAQGVDVVIGSKQHPQSRIQYPLLRRLYSYTYYLLVRLMFGLPVRDTQTGIKLFRRDVLASAFPQMAVQKYAFDLELLALAHANGARIAEAPVTLASQRLSQRIKAGDVLVMLRDTLGIWWRLRTRQYKLTGRSRVNTRS